MKYDSGICKAAYMAGITVDAPFVLEVNPNANVAVDSCTANGLTSTSYGNYDYTYKIIDHGCPVAPSSAPTVPSHAATYLPTHLPTHQWIVTTIEACGTSTTSNYDQGDTPIKRQPMWATVRSQVHCDMSALELR